MNKDCRHIDNKGYCKYYKDKDNNPIKCDLNKYCQIRKDIKDGMNG